jgi:hypothetical protein
MTILRNPISRKSDHQRDKNEIQLRGMRIFLMDNRAATDIVVDTTISHNTDSKLLDNVIFNNTTQYGLGVQIAYHSQINICVTSYINDNVT